MGSVVSCRLSVVGGDGATAVLLLSHRHSCPPIPNPPTPNHSYTIPCNGPPGAARASTRREIAGSSTSGGAWCGFAPGVDHQRTAAAPVLRGRERLDPVNVRRRIAPGERRPEQIVQPSGRELAVVDHDDQREAIDRRRPSNDAAKRSTAAGLARRTPALGRPESPARRPAGSEKPSPSGSASRLSIAVGNSRMAGPAAAMTTFDPRFSPSPE